METIIRLKRLPVNDLTFRFLREDNNKIYSLPAAELFALGLSVEEAAKNSISTFLKEENGNDVKIEIDGDFPFDESFQNLTMLPIDQEWLSATSKHRSVLRALKKVKFSAVNSTLYQKQTTWGKISKFLPNRLVWYLQSKFNLSQIKIIPAWYFCVRATRENIKDAINIIMDDLCLLKKKCGIVGSFYMPSILPSWDINGDQAFLITASAFSDSHYEKVQALDFKSFAIEGEVGLDLDPVKPKEVIFPFSKYNKTVSNVVQLEHKVILEKFQRSFKGQIK